MHYLIAAIYFMFALLGWDGFGARTIATHAFEHGTEVLYSEVSITPVLARFDCVGSASGRCHYRLFPAQCAHPAPAALPSACLPKAVREFVLARGDSTRLTGMPDDFNFCVSSHALPLNTPCKLRVHAGLAHQSH
jgi:hypothetical protein